jgi:predicted phosphodiesterase
MRLAVLSDIHGNPIALEAVLADVAAAGGADAYWVLGDFSALGPDPATPLERVSALPGARFVRGNTDDYLVTDQRPPPSAEDVARVPGLAGRFAEVAASFAWSAGYLAGRGWLPWLADLPLEQRLTLPDGTRLLGVHAAPGTAHGDGIRPTHSDDELAELVSVAEADLVLVGHTHWALDRTVYDVRIVNLGSVSNPLAPDLRASYALIEADEAGYRLEQRRVDYDHQAVIAALAAAGHPAGDFVARYQRGEQRPPWQV